MLFSHQERKKKKKKGEKKNTTKKTHKPQNKNPNQKPHTHTLLELLILNTRYLENEVLVWSTTERNGYKISKLGLNNSSALHLSHFRFTVSSTSHLYLTEQRENLTRT